MPPCFFLALTATFAAVSAGFVGCDDAPEITTGGGDARPSSATTRAESPSAEGASLASKHTPPGIDPRIQDAIVASIGRGAFDEADRRIAEYLDVNPTSGEAIFLRGLVQHRQRRYAAARPDFEEALRRAPAHHVVQHFLGYCRYYLGDMEGARRAFVAHLQAMPDEADSHFGLGLVELEDGRLDEAERAFTQAIELTERLRTHAPRVFARRRGDLAKGHARLGDVHLARGDLEAARASFRAAVALDGNLGLAWYRLGLVSRRLGDQEAAANAMRVFESIKSRTPPGRTMGPG